MRRYLIGLLAVTRVTYRRWRAYRAKVICCPATPCDGCLASKQWPTVPITYCQLDRISKQAL